ncbi:TolC family protein, partial [Shewanella sp. SR41-2]|nr:TolC family protein [Shewanella sp. SR41-2]
MMVKPARRHAMLALIIVSLLGCSTVDNSNYIDQASQAQAKTSQQLIEQLLAVSNTQGVPSQSLARLTDLINVPELQTFISAALQNNPSLQQSVVALNMAYAQHGITSASRLPSVDASFSGTST